MKGSRTIQGSTSPITSPVLLVALCALLAAWLVAPLPAVAQPNSSEAEEPSPREQALQQIQQQIAGLEDRLGELRETAGGLQGRLERVELELELQTQRVSEAETAREVALEKVETSTRQVERLEQDLTQARQDLRSRLRALYRLGSFGYLRMFLAVGPDADPLEALRGLRYLARRDAAAVEHFVDTQERLADERQVLVMQFEEAESWAQQETERRRELATLRRRQANVLAEVRRESDRVAAEAERLRDKERKLANLLASLADSAGSDLEGTPIQDFKSALDWPAPGEVAVGFGTVRDPRYRTRLPHHGIEIALQRRQPVRSVYPGKVLFAGPFEGYGAMVVMLHPGRVFTVYGGLESLRVEADDVLSLSDAVGLASNTFYFEIRVENRPEDPLQWLR